MRHHLKITASNFKIDEQKLTTFALENHRKYGIIDENGFVTTSTWYTDNLVKDFKNQNK